MHTCQKPESIQCKFAWRGYIYPQILECGKRIKCPNCGEIVSPYLKCGDITKCKYYEPKRWFNFIPAWLGLPPDALKWFPGEKEVK